MKVLVLLLFLPLLTTGLAGLAGCSEPACRNAATDGFTVTYINETDQSYFIYLDWGTGKFHEVDFSPAESSSSAGSTSPGCDTLGSYLRIQIREPKPNQQDIHDPEIRGGALVFDGNWTGMRCNEGYVFRYNGPSDAEAYERKCNTSDTWQRDLQRVPP